MNELIIFIAEKIDLINNEKAKKNETIIELNANIALLNNFIDDVNLIKDNIDSFKSLVPIENNACSLVIQLIINNDYDRYSTQSQVVESKNILIETIKESISNYQKKLEETKAKKINEEDIDKYDHILDIIKNYNSDTYINAEELLKLKKIISEFLLLNNNDENVNNEIIKFTMDILINNSRIEKLNSIVEENQDQEHEQEQSLSADKLNEMDRDRELINASESDKNVESKKKDKYIERLINFLTNDEFKSIDENLYTKACYIVNKAIEILKSEEELDLEFIEKEIELTDISALDGLYLQVSSAIFLLESYERKNKEDISSIIDLYKNAPALNIKDFFEVENYSKFAELIKKIEKLISGKINKESFDDFAYDDIMKTIEDETGLMEYKLSAVLKGIDLVAADRIINDEEKIKLNNLFELANKIIKENKTEKNDTTNNNDDDEIIEYFYSKFNELKNYIVFYNSEDFLASLKKAITEHSSHKYEIITDVLDKINKLVTTDIARLQLKDVSHNVHLGLNTPNPYNILALTHKASRVTFKIIENSGIIDSKSDEKHNVIVLLNALFGDTDADTKSVDELASVKVFEKTMDTRYGYVKKYKTKKPSETSTNGLYQIFSKENNNNGITDSAILELKESKRVIDEIEKMLMEISKEISSNENKNTKKKKKGGGIGNGK